MRCSELFCTVLSTSKLCKNIDNKTWLCYIVNVNKTWQKRGVFMNKEEVLAKANRENFLGDEREKIYVPKGTHFRFGDLLF